MIKESRSKRIAEHVLKENHNVQKLLKQVQSQIR